MLSWLDQCVAVYLLSLISSRNGRQPLTSRHSTNHSLLAKVEAISSANSFFLKFKERENDFFYRKENGDGQKGW